MNAVPWPSFMRLSAELVRCPEASLFDALEFSRFCAALADLSEQLSRYGEHPGDLVQAWVYATTAGEHARALRGAGVDLERCVCVRAARRPLRAPTTISVESEIPAAVLP